ncbi:hypothetical protein Pan216_32790 [Planctomycetes bacterium Pan216]|uniref:Uncharacterized protein n=1 Tax=Kolteria novifilia TaxID=2527975 RepID=A0A518B659_9BACT|nr:hypothetical protein Pan216_32790 [Planctomycetes bacterium Pan216]
MSTPSHGPRAADSLEAIQKSVRLSPPALERLKGEGKGEPLEYIGALHAAGYDVDAIRVLSYWLPSRAAVWWTILCAWHGSGGNPPYAEDVALREAVHWTLEPTEEHCHKARDAATLARLRTSAGCAAKSACMAGFCGAHGDPLVGGKPLQVASVASAGVLLACGAAKRAGRGSSYAELLEIGLDVDRGKLPWGPQ